MLQGARQIFELGSHNSTVPLGLVQRTEPITNSLVQFTELKLTTVDRCSSANCKSEFLIGAVR